MIITFFWGATVRAETPPPGEVVSHPGLLEVVESALRRNRQLQSQQWQVEISRGTLQQATGQFDAALSAGVTRGHDKRFAELAPNGLYQTETDTLNYNLSLSQQLRNGITVSPGVSVSQTQDNYQYLEAAGTGEATLQVNVPLLRGRGELATDGPEQAAKLGVKAARLIYAQAVAETASASATAYWNWLAADDQLAVQRAAEARARLLLKETEALVKASMVPAAELDKLEANLAASTGTRLLAESSLFAARQSLGLTMGLKGGEISRLAPVEEPFPDIASAVVPTPAMADAYAAMALKLRQDYAAAAASEQAQKILYRASKLNEKPQFDLGLQAGFTGFELNHFSDPYGALARNTVGPVYGASFTLAWPFANNTARGYTRQQRAQYEQARLQAADLAAKIESSVASAVESLRISILALQQARQASRFFTESVRKEREKFQLGESTVIDQLTIEGLATQADLSLINAQLLYATALVQLRLETGTLIEAHDGNFSLVGAALRTLPPAGS